MQKETKKTPQKADKKERTYSFRGLAEEFRKIIWPRWTSKRGEPCVLGNSAKVIGFSLTIIVYFMIGGFIIAKTLQLIGAI